MKLYHFKKSFELLISIFASYCDEFGPLPQCILTLPSGIFGGKGGLILLLRCKYFRTTQATRAGTAMILYIEQEIYCRLLPCSTVNLSGISYL
jgi:hypothetical protein